MKRERVSRYGEVREEQVLSKARKSPRIGLIPFCYFGFSSSLIVSEFSEGDFYFI